MSNLLLKLVLLMFPKREVNNKVWELFHNLANDRKLNRKSSYALIVVSLVLVVEHVFIPLGIIWLIKTILMLIVNKLSPHG